MGREPMNYPLNVKLKRIGVEECDLHEIAGLMDGGIDEEGQIQWIGTKQQWERYEELSNNEPYEHITF